jgi:DNA-binding NtrC family response regulator
LRNALERAAIVCEDGVIQPQDLGLRHRPRAAVQTPASPSNNLTVVERETIARVLQETFYNKSIAANRLGLSRTQLYTRMRKYGLERHDSIDTIVQ